MIRYMWIEMREQKVIMMLLMLAGCGIMYAKNPPRWVEQPVTPEDDIAHIVCFKGVATRDNKDDALFFAEYDAYIQMKRYLDGQEVSAQDIREIRKHGMEAWVGRDQRRCHRAALYETRNDNEATYTAYVLYQFQKDISIEPHFYNYDSKGRKVKTCEHKLTYSVTFGGASGMHFHNNNSEAFFPQTLQVNGHLGTGPFAAGIYAELGTMVGDKGTKNWLTYSVNARIYCPKCLYVNIGWGTIIPQHVFPSRPDGDGEWVLEGYQMKKGPMAGAGLEWKIRSRKNYKSNFTIGCSFNYAWTERVCMIQFVSIGYSFGNDEKWPL